MIPRTQSTFYTKTGKRLFDSVTTGLGLLLLLPVLLFLMLLVKLTSPGPAIYWQERVGLGGKVFRIAKLRSMLKDAENRGSSITSSGDARVTRLGGVLRRLKVDELPQLWNVLKGEMALVGPRPEVALYVASYSASQRRVLTVRPGITGPASIAYQNEEKLLGAQTDPDRYYRDVLLPQKLSISLEYVDHISFFYDLSLLFRTTGSIFVSRLTTRNT